MQYKTFVEYNENRTGQEFGSKYLTLCEAIARSGHSFDEYWENVGLPTMLKSPYMESEEELLNSLLLEFDWGKLNPMNWFGGGGQQQPDPAAAQQPPAPDPRMAKHQGRADAAVKSVSQKFQVAMRDFLKMVSDEAKQNNDRFTWQIAKMFHDKAIKSMQAFAVNVKQGQGTDPMAQQFQQDRGAMQANQQANMKNALQQKMQANPAMGAKLAMQKIKKATDGNPSMGMATFYDPAGGFTQAAADQFGIPRAWVGKTVEAIGGGGGNQVPGGPPAVQQPQQQPNSSTPAGTQTMRRDHTEDDGDLMIESLIQTYSNKPKFGLF